ncbi:MAG: AgmX/PglI C-terminal domain-containing protein [Proteobacteria bacterium]|nr:AgmX/PglI C-terminal domain-containing protein [Cystobacterineae bacterium]MCL2259320.1 AgmX/PglI C-terminal domain-containing protein [Cystobacterineae bacterium]MCL2314229.1 AgmX/PglI C-terminal domain-containing protein [Pseudomonadota bacterium]
MQACYEAQLVRYPKLAGRLTLHLVINNMGTVDALTMNNKEMGDCVANEIRLLEFPRPQGGGTVQVTYSFTFKPTG